MNAIVSVLDQAVKTPSRSQILRLETEIGKLDQVKMPVKHNYCGGVYARELFIPKGTVLTGKIHKYENLNILVKGDISVLTEDGIVRINANLEPITICSKAGSKRVGYAHEDTIWITFHATDETNLDKIEEMFVVDTYEEFELFIEDKQLALEGK